MAASPICRRVVVHGRVQGVWFRDATREVAQRHGVAGWVRNRPDGAVEALLEGDPRAVERVVDFCRLGPPRAEVTAVEVHEAPAAGLRGFDVRRG